MKRLICLIAVMLLYAMPSAGRELMLPEVYTDEVDVSGWLMSEKLDGVRGYWTGRELLSKNGVVFSPPDVFLHNFPPFALEGELWGGRGTFTQTVSVVNTQGQHDGWHTLKFAVFDVPKEKGGFLQRIAKAKAWFVQHPAAYAYVIEQKQIEESLDIEVELKRIEELGGEGLVVRSANGLYTGGRSAEILKVKSFMDAEATVIKHLPGKGRNAERLGALLVEEENGTRFKLGGGFTDKERESPPPIGSIVTFKYYGRYPSGKPRFPSFLRIRKDAEL